MAIKDFTVIDIQAFAEGAAASGGAASAGAGSSGNGGGEVIGKTANAAAVSNARANKNPLADTIYGTGGDFRGDGDAGRNEESGQGQKSAQEIEADFENLIKGEYKDAFTKRTQGIINERFKETKGLEAQLKSLTPVLEMLSEKYGVDAKNPEDILKALENDNSYWEDEADRRGLTVNQLKEMKRLERESAELRNLKQERERRENADRQYAQWLSQAQAASAVYPNLNLSAEMLNPKFTKLLAHGIDVKTAYEVAHMGEIIGSNVKTAEHKTIENIKASQSVPRENGTGSSAAGPLVKKSASDFTKADREEIARRVQRGEKIYL